MTKEEMEQQIHDFAEMMYKTGYEDGQKSRKENDQDYKDGLEDGRMEAWKCAKKIMQLPNDTQELFYLSAEEAITKIKEYEEEQQNIKSCDIEFRVGDIVFLNQNVKAGKGIIERISFDYGIKEEKAFVNFGRGSNGWYVLSHLTNTGKHYPLINEILGEIQGEE